MAKEQRTFLFVKQGEYDSTDIPCSVEANRDTRTIRLAFDLSSEERLATQQHIDKNKGRIAERIAADIARPFWRVMDVISDAWNRREPLIAFSRLYRVEDSNVMAVDIKLDKAADFNKVLSAVIENMVEHRLNESHSYSYNGGQFGYKQVPVEQADPPHEWSAEELREAETFRREDETPLQHATRLRRAQRDEDDEVASYADDSPASQVARQQLETYRSERFDGETPPHHPQTERVLHLDGHLEPQRVNQR